MIDVPYEQAIAKIKEEKGLSDEEIEQRVQKKLEELSGLISKDGAIHILANELGVKLVQEVQGGGEVTINQLTLGARGITVTGQVIQKYEVRTFNKNGREGKVASLLFGDESGVTRLVFWNDQVETFEALKDGDVLKVVNPFVKQSYMKDRVELQLNDQSQLTVNPVGVTVNLKERSQERQQKYIKNLVGGEQNVEVIATIVQVYDPIFYDACPECRKKVTDNLCATHGEVTPQANFNISTFIDDGTGNIRTSFWKNQSLQLTGMNEETFAKFREDPTTFETVKNDLLGEIVKIVGNVRKNEQFDRIEMTAQRVFTDVDPAQEIKNLEQKFEETPEKPAETPKMKEEVISLDDLQEMGK